MLFNWHAEIAWSFLYLSLGSGLGAYLGVGTLHNKYVLVQPTQYNKVGHYGVHAYSNILHYPYLGHHNVPLLDCGSYNILYILLLALRR